MGEQGPQRGEAVGIVELVSDIIIGTLSVLFGIMLYAVIFRPYLLVRKKKR